MKKMFIRAYCQSNLGDDLFVLQLARRYPDTQFYLYALGENQNAFRNQPNLILPGTWDRIRFLIDAISSLLRGISLSGMRSK